MFSTAMLALALGTTALLAPVQKAEMMVVTTERPRVFRGGAHIRFADQEGDGRLPFYAAAAPWDVAVEVLHRRGRGEGVPSA